MTVTVYFDFGSPYAYLAWQRITNVRAQLWTDVDVAWRPVSAGHIFKQDGTAPNVTMPNQRKYLVQDVRRWADAYGIPFSPPAFGTPGEMPVNAINALRLHFVAQDQGKAAAWRQAVFMAYFGAGRDISDAAVLAALLEEAGIDATVQDAADAEIKGRLVAATSEAYEAGAPGVPFTVHDGDGYWGNDRLAWVEARMAGLGVPA